MDEAESAPVLRNRRTTWIALLWGGAGVLLVLAVFARGMQPERPPAPEDVEPQRPRIQAPMQFLSGGAGERVAELDGWVSEDWRVIWTASRGIAFHIEGCPELREWMESTEGLRIERLLEGLRRGSREDALAALALIFRAARGTDWAPGLRGRPQNAERLGALLQQWLRVWGQRASDDPLLHQPALAAVLVYGRVMRIAWRAPVVGHNAAAYARATAFLDDLCGLGDTRTPFGRALQARYERAFALLEGDQDRLAGLSDEAVLLFPDVDGSCD